MTTGFLGDAPYVTGDHAGAGYAFLRYLGEKVALAMAATDSKWVLEQVVDVEAPEAIKTLKKMVGQVLGVKVF